jgi:allantoin racemase
MTRGHAAQVFNHRINQNFAMTQLLIINPNTSSGVTEKLTQFARAMCIGDQSVEGLTARFGANYIVDEASFAIAAHATLDAWAFATTQAHLKPASVLVACFGDPGLIALRENCPVPVTGLAQAAFFAAAKHGRYAVVTGGERWKPMLQRLAISLNQQDHLAGIHTVAPSGAELATNPERAIALLVQACKDAQTIFKADAVILGGAGLAGLAETIQKQLSTPLIDSVQAGIEAGLSLLGKTSEHTKPKTGLGLSNVSPELRKMFSL